MAATRNRPLGVSETGSSIINQLPNPNFLIAISIGFYSAGKVNRKSIREKGGTMTPKYWVVKFWSQKAPPYTKRRRMSRHASKLVNRCDLWMRKRNEQNQRDNQALWQPYNNGEFTESSHFPKTSEPVKQADTRLRPLVGALKWKWCHRRIACQWYFIDGQ
jgi:hypothetical protein